MTVDEIRRDALKRRRSLSQKENERRGEQIQRQAAQRLQTLGARLVYCYVSVPPEAPTRQLIQRLWAEGGRVAVPRVEKNSTTMRLHELTDMRQLERGLWGIPAPPSTAPRVHKEALDAALIPCAAVDSRGNRIGRGGGFHDRFFAEEPRPRMIGLAFDCQRTAPFEPMPWDVPLDELIAESGAFYFQSKQAAPDVRSYRQTTSTKRRSS